MYKLSQNVLLKKLKHNGCCALLCMLIALMLRRFASPSGTYLKEILCAMSDFCKNWLSLAVANSEKLTNHIINRLLKKLKHNLCCALLCMFIALTLRRFASPSGILLESYFVWVNDFCKECLSLSKYY